MRLNKVFIFVLLLILLLLLLLLLLCKRRAVERRYLSQFMKANICVEIGKLSVLPFRGRNVNWLPLVIVIHPFT